jgi:hypothetical protein
VAWTGCATTACCCCRMRRTQLGARRISLTFRKVAASA